MFVSIALFACNNGSSEPEFNTVDEVWTAFNDRDYDAVEAAYASDASFAAPGADVALDGATAIVDGHERALASAFTDVRVEPQTTWLSEDEAAAIVWVHGTHDGTLSLSFGDIPATGAEIGVLAMQHLVLDGDARIVREAWMVDEVALAVQLGVAEGSARPVMDEAWDTRPVVVAESSDAEADNADRHAYVYELFSAHDAAMFDYFADDIVESNPSEAEDIEGSDTLQAFNESMWAGFSDIRVDVDTAWGAGEWSVVQGRLVGTNDGLCEAFGVDSTGLAVDVSFIEAVQWKDGIAVLARPFMNSAQLAGQLGMM